MQMIKSAQGVKAAGQISEIAQRNNASALSRTARLSRDLSWKKRGLEEEESRAPVTMGLFLFSALATLPAIALFAVVHGAVFVGLFAIRLVRCKSRRANHCRQNRNQDFRVILHRLTFISYAGWLLAKNEEPLRQRKYLNISDFESIEEEQ
jgi:hypothetical protein